MFSIFREILKYLDMLIYVQAYFATIQYDLAYSENYAALANLKPLHSESWIIPTYCISKTQHIFHKSGIFRCLAYVKLKTY